MEQPPKVTHRDRADRRAAGKAARQRAPLESHAEVVTGGRADPIGLLEGQAASRVPELVPIRYGRMLASPFAFYRGGALVMASDLARTPDSGLQVQLCGDAHLSNFGIYASPERRLVFDINDFDETHPGPFEWDVKRLAASFEIAGRSRGFDAKQCTALVTGTVKSYRRAMRTFAGMSNLDIWYASLDVDGIMRQWGGEMGGKAVKALQRSTAKAESKDRLKAKAKLTQVIDGEL
ncbi:MAG TPA: DUF2252 family protein, partial [Actinomycetes bacterium]